jgi:hypothetical protein
MASHVGVLATVLVVIGAFWQSSVADWDGLKEFDLLGSERAKKRKSFPFRKLSGNYDEEKLRRVKWEVLGWLFVIAAAVAGLVSIELLAYEAIDWFIIGAGIVAMVTIYLYFNAEKSNYK